MSRNSSFLVKINAYCFTLRGLANLTGRKFCEVWSRIVDRGSSANLIELSSFCIFYCNKKMNVVMIFLNCSKLLISQITKQINWDWIANMEKSIAMFWITLFQRNVFDKNVQLLIKFKYYYFTTNKTILEILFEMWEKIVQIEMKIFVFIYHKWKYFWFQCFFNLFNVLYIAISAIIKHYFFLLEKYVILRAWQYQVYFFLFPFLYIGFSITKKSNPNFKHLQK